MICKLIHTGKVCPAECPDTELEILGYKELVIESVFEPMEAPRLRFYCLVTYQDGKARRGTEHWDDIEADIKNGYLEQVK